MHEMSLMNSLMSRIYEVAAKENAKAVRGVKVWIGALAHMSADHFSEHFVEAARGSIADGARIEAEVSDDPDHPQADAILLKSIDISDE